MNRCLKVAVLAALCTSCQATAIEPSPVPDPAPTPPPPSPTPPPPIELMSNQLLAGSNPSEWSVIGLVENHGSTVVSDIELKVTVTDADNQILAEALVNTAVSNLMPGENGPFVAPFEVEERPSSVTVEVQAFETIEGRRGALDAELEEFFLTGNGELAILGVVANSGDRDVSLNSLSFLGRDPDGSEKILATMLFGPEVLAAGETVPILVIAPENPGAVRWTLYHDGLIAESHTPGSLEILGEAVLRITAQGAPFVVGTIVNSGSQGMEGSVLVAMYDGNHLIGLWEIESPRPLGPGEQLPFTAFGFPGVSLRFDPSVPDQIRVETRVDSRRTNSDSRAVDLPIDVTSFVSVGSALFLRGTVKNAMQSDVDSSAVYAEIRSTDGELISADWSMIGPLEAGALGDFVLDLPIPAGMDPALTEYDLRAIGLTASP